MSVNILYWNYRGAGNQRFCDILKDLCRIHKVDFVFITEPKISDNKAEAIIKKLSMDCIHRVKVVGRSGGVWMLSKNSSFKVEVIQTRFHFIHFLIRDKGRTLMTCTTVYIHPQGIRKKQCLENLKSLASYTTGPWMLIGDFNEIMYDREKKWGAPANQGRCFCFRKWVNECKLINMEATGPKFTWRGPVHRGFGSIYMRGLIGFLVMLNGEIISRRRV